ncbi:YbjQ family protein [Sulfitobacter sp. R86518]|uniref:YbjQ family protein n=1 Tax=Sulfitobacter sp. R86518 TaxID=3093858 RepID=UPI0036DA988B
MDFTTMTNCIQCGKSLTVWNKVSEDKCYSCVSGNEKAAREKAAEKTKHGSEAEAALRKARDASIEAIMVTTETHPSIGISQRLGIVTAECAYGMNVFKDVFAGIRNIVGGRSKAVQQTMRDARETVLYELKQEASLLGADAVVAVDLDYVQIGDGGWSMVMLVASGTAVKIEQPAAA